MPTIQKFINDRNKYKIDRNYQRPADAWSLSDNQCLIDTIFRGEPMPIFFMNYKTNEDVYYIVDGQQRLNAIRKFYDNKYKLNKKFSGENLNNKTFNGEIPLEDKYKESFLDYNLNFHILEDYDDERIRMIFSRLQRGKPLQLGERLNALPGEIVIIMRELANHPFLAKSVGVSKTRYGNYPDAARILFYEKYGAKQMGSNELYEFFDDFQKLDKNSKEFKTIISNLNFLEKCFPSNPGNYAYINNHAWVLGVYTFISELNTGYSLHEQEKNIREFIKSFHSKVYNEDFRISNHTYQKFYDNIRGGWSETIIKLRRNILIQEFLKKYDIFELDERRQITEEEKISKFSLSSSCEKCGKDFKDHKEAEYHHKTRYSDGGKSSLENIMILCNKCHKIIHGSENDIIENEEEFEEIE